MSRFGGGNRAGKKQGIIDKLRGFFEKYFGLGIVMKPKAEYPEPKARLSMVAEEKTPFGKK